VMQTSVQDAERITLEDFPVAKGQEQEGISSREIQVFREVRFDREIALSVVRAALAFISSPFFPAFPREGKDLAVKLLGKDFFFNLQERASKWNGLAPKSVSGTVLRVE
jgi:hypothetical protein